MNTISVNTTMLKINRKKLNASTNERKYWFRIVKNLLRLIIKEPQYIYLGKKVSEPSIILTNHVGPSAPLVNELYSDTSVRLWGAHEMNESFISAYKYQTHIYYHQKQHWNLHLARLFCLIASPVTYMYYKGINLISSYADVRFKKTLTESINALKDGHSVIVFPEKSDNGYLKVLTGFYPGAIMLLQQCKRHNINPPVYIAYLNKDTNQYIFDAPSTANELLELGHSRNDLAALLCDRCNELGRMQISI